MSRDSARKVLKVTSCVSWGNDDQSLLWREREAEEELTTYFEPMQFRDPVENGRKASFSSLSNRESYSGCVAGSQRSGWNTSGSTQLVGEFEAANAGIEIVAWRPD